MPLYVYRCPQCGHEFEKMMRLSESDRTPVCPQCGSENSEKQITAFASRLIGGVVSTSSTSNCSSGGGRFS
ncbi:MAG: zinc ribbon domain-containing protein [Anaerolineae bacterium]|nr:zinc ribbon domain-containing protein [Anaerolineae bacterium]